MNTIPYKIVRNLQVAGIRRVLTFQSPTVKLWATMALEASIIEERLLSLSGLGQRTHLQFSTKEGMESKEPLADTSALVAEHFKKLEVRGWARMVDGVPYATNKAIRLLKSLMAFKEGDTWSFSLLGHPGDEDLCLLPQEEIAHLDELSQKEMN